MRRVGRFVAAALVAAPAAIAAGMPDPLAFFAADVRLDAGERLRAAAGIPAVRTLPAGEGQLATFVAVAVRAPAAALADAARRPAHRLPPLPDLRHFDALTLTAGELDALRSCEPAACDVKLPGHEIAALRAARAQPDGRSAAALTKWFRGMLLRRVRAYRAGGARALWPYVDRAVPVHPEDVLAVLLLRMPSLRQQAPGVADDLSRYPFDRVPLHESVIAWSRQPLGGTSAVVVTHARIYPPHTADDAALVTMVDVYASRYRSGALSVIRAAPDAAGRTWVAMSSRSQVDRLRGPMGALRRRGVERQAQDDVRRSFAELTATFP